MTRFLLRPVSRTLLMRSDAARGPLTLPTDEPRVDVPGPRPARVLLVGSGPAAGVGVRSHVHALTGALAWRLSSRTGRGTVVESIGRTHLRLRDVPALIAEHPRRDLQRFDAVVLTAGAMEALDLTSDRTWHRWLLAVAEMLQNRAARDIPVVVTGMPAPSSTIIGGSGWRSRFVDRRAAGLNRVSSAVASGERRWHFAQLRPSEHRHGQPTASGYTEWAAHIAEVLAPLLTA